MKTEQDSAQLGHVGEFKVVDRAGNVKPFKAKTIGRHLRPDLVDAKAPAVQETGVRLIPDEDSDE
jgi:hypothetical protein